jgi:uncharacterized protein
MTALTVRWHTEMLAVGTLPVDADIAWIDDKAPIHGSLVTDAGRTIVFPHRQASEAGHLGRFEGPFRALEVQGPLEFALTGVLASVLTPLADAEISVFTLSTFDTDWILVPAGSTGAATRALRAAGHTVITEEHP